MSSHSRVLLTGANGQLGQEFFHFFKKKHPSILVKATSSSELDISDHSSLSKFFSQFKPNVLINCAAYTKVDLAESDEGYLTAFKVNNEAVKILLGLCEEFNTKLVHFSTDYVFDGLIDANAFYSEESLPSPINKYGETKLLGDNEILSSNVDFIIARVAWLTGAYGWNFVRAIEKKIQTENELNIVDDQIGTPSFTHDVVDKVWELILRNKKGLFNVASSNACNRLAFAKEIVRNLGKGNQVSLTAVKTADFKSDAQRPLKTPLSTDKLEQVLGFPIKKWQVQLSECMNQMKDVSNER